jgi:hypothetical protein
VQALRFTEPPVILAEEHAVGRRKADIDRVAFTEDMGIDDRVGLELSPSASMA